MPSQSVRRALVLLMMFVAMGSFATQWAEERQDNESAAAPQLSLLCGSAAGARFKPVRLLISHRGSGIGDDRVIHTPTLDL